MDRDHGAAQVLEEIRLLTENTRDVVFVSGNFNVVHPGHLRLLRFAAECGDTLVVGIIDGATPGVTVPENMRLEGIKAISLVDYAFILREMPEQFIVKLKPAIVVKSKEHETRFNPEAEAVRTRSSPCESLETTATVSGNVTWRTESLCGNNAFAFSSANSGLLESRTSKRMRWARLR